MKVVISIFSVLISFAISAQIAPKRELDLQRLVDEILANQDEDYNYEDLYENLAQLLSNPIDLNLVTKEHLQSLFFLSEIQIQALLNYRTEAGPFLSVYELQNVPGINRDTFMRLIPFITVSDLTTGLNRSLLSRILDENNNYLIFRIDRTLEEKRGFKADTPPASQYAGSPHRIYTRFEQADLEILVLDSPLKKMLAKNHAGHLRKNNLDLTLFPSTLK
jgi:DNA uptake protein ComE-like DNA-binding protein